MKKVYLISAVLKENRKVSCVIEVFENKQLAEAYVKYWNDEEDHPWRYYVRELGICESDYRGCSH